jgi:hyperosmotically inducible periplasmic protein
MKKTICRAALIAMIASLFIINVHLAASEMDDRIESTAKESYVFKTYLQGDDIDIASEDGAVTLTGTVAEETRKTLAQETVASLPGVISVDNKLEVKEENLPVYSDAWLIAKVKSTLFFHRNVSAVKTEVLAKDGIITLRGETASEAHKDLATEYAKDIEGVRDVKNEMMVVTAASKPDKKVKAEKMDAQVKPGEKTMGQKMGDVVDDTTGYIDDASITAMVKSTLMYHRSTSALKTTVKTNEGVVSLGGKAANAAEKDLAAKLVSDVYGVKRVINNMTIESTVSTIN